MENYIKCPDDSNSIEPHNVRLRQIYEELKRTMPIEKEKRQTPMEYGFSKWRKGRRRRSDENGR